VVANITIPHSLIETLNYNEKKVQKGAAQCIGERNCLLDHDNMNFYQKLAQFENRNVLNDRAATKTLHVSLNFDPSEKIPIAQLVDIAETYMQKIGFGGQPYLIYQHHDAGHPHMHIVSTTIKEDGSRINTHNIGRNQSEKARKEIESDFNLVKAENQKRQYPNEIKPVDAEKVQYGKSETKRSITNVLNAVVTKYNYTSLPELNAILKQFNVMADRGQEDGIMFKNKGLLYRILNNEGIAIGVPIKASSINNKPTLEKLETHFEKNKTTRDTFKQKLKTILDEALQQNPGSIAQLKQTLSTKQVFTAIRQNAEGRIYGITFVDNKNRTVFNGSEIGKLCSISHLQSQLLKNDAAGPPISEKETTDTPAPILKTHPVKKHKQLLETRPPATTAFLEQLMSPTQQFDSVPFQLMKKKKRKKRKQYVINRRE